MITWIRKNFFSIVFGLVFLYPLWNSYWANLFQEKVFWFILSIVCLCLTQLSRFKKIKGLGMEAELWDETQNKAEALTKQLGSLADLVIQGQVLTFNRIGQTSLGNRIRRKKQWEKFQETKSKYALDSSEKTLEQFQLIVLQWWAEDINDQTSYRECKDETISRERSSLKLNFIHGYDMASSFKKEGNRILKELETNLEKFKTSSSFEKEVIDLEEIIMNLKVFVETGEFAKEAWFSKLLETTFK